MGRIEDDKHALVLEVWEPDTEYYEIDVVHSQSCTVWFGCEFREEKGVQRLGGCPNYHHAHRRLDCPIGYSLEAIGLKDTLFYGDSKLEEETLAVLQRYVGQAVPIHCDFSWGMTGYFEPEYDEELIWTFHPFWTHTWAVDQAVCTVCKATKLYVLNMRKECNYGKPE